MFDRFQWDNHGEEPLWSYREARECAKKVREMAALHPGVARELIEAAVMIETLANCTDSYRHRWVSALRRMDDMRNTPRHEAQEKNDGKRDQ